MNDRIDPELLRQLDLAGADAKIGAVIKISPPSAQMVVPNPEETERIALELLDRVGKREKAEAVDFNVFRNLGYFVVSASPAYLKALIEEPEVANALANRPGDTDD